MTHAFARLSLLPSRTGRVIFIRHENDGIISALNVYRARRRRPQSTVPLRNVLRVYFRFIYPGCDRRKYRRPIYLVRAASVSTQSVRDYRYPSSPNAFALAGL